MIKDVNGNNKRRYIKTNPNKTKRIKKYKGIHEFSDMYFIYIRSHNRCDKMYKVI